MKCSCFSISLFLLITIKNNDGSWSSESTDTSDDIIEILSLEELENTDPESYRQVVEARPQLLELRERMKRNLSSDDQGQHVVEQRPMADKLLIDLRRKDLDYYQQELKELQDTDFEIYRDNLYDDEWVQNVTNLRINVTMLPQYNATLPRAYNNRSRRDNAQNTLKYAKHLANDYYWSNWYSSYRLHYSGSFVQSCYECGNTEESISIPKSPLCHDAFESPDWRARTKARYFRTKCYRNTYNDMKSFSRRKPFLYDEKIFYASDPGLKSRKFGLKMGGCYKRFLDVGKVYTQRGCRRWPPGPWYWNGNKTGNFASHRFRKLEYLLGEEKVDRCLFSPHASLTPFHRGISLFARYHVCVCHTDYCNGGPPTLQSFPSASLAVFAIHVIFIIIQ